LALASTFAVPRPWYIVDEPTLGQDDPFMQGFATLLTSLTSEGYGIVVISHAPSFTTLLDSVPFHLANPSANGRQG
jgi:energy-coupling factor transporter ATP-binding protein EcfA2